MQLEAEDSKPLGEESGPATDESSASAPPEAGDPAAATPTAPDLPPAPAGDDLGDAADISDETAASSAPEPDDAQAAETGLGADGVGSADLDPSSEAPVEAPGPEPADSAAEAGDTEAESPSAESPQESQPTLEAGEPAAADEQPETEAATPEAGASPAASGPAAIPGLPDMSVTDEDLLEEIPEFEDPETLPDIPADGSPVVRTGARCTGSVVAVRESDVIVAFGTKVEGSVPLEEFRDDEGNVTVSPGQEIEVVVERMGAPGEYAALSFKRARELAVWSRIQEAHAKNLPLQGTIVGPVKGGLRVDVGLPAFMPASQIDIRPTRDVEPWVGKEVEVAVLECDRRRGNVVVSRSSLLAAEQRALRAETLAKLAVGEPATGEVTTITSFGVFVELGGIEGMIKFTDLAYGRVGKAEDHVEQGKPVTAMVMGIDEDKGRVALSLKGMVPDPWLSIEERYAVGQTVRGRVASVKDYGAFIALEPGLEGLIHSTEIDWSRRAKHPTKTFTPDTEVEAVVLAVDTDKRRISLSTKRLTPDPWETHADSLRVGSVVQGVVRKIETYGLFVEVEPGIEGLVHVSDLSWDSRQTHPREVAQKGQEISAVVLQADTANRKLSLGVKQLQPDAWDDFLLENSVGDVVQGTVRRLVKFGAFVELATGVEGLCHASQLPKDRSAIEPGQEHEFEILELNERARRIGLRYR